MRKLHYVLLMLMVSPSIFAQNEPPTTITNYIEMWAAKAGQTAGKQCIVLSKGSTTEVQTPNVTKMIDFWGAIPAATEEYTIEFWLQVGKSLGGQNDFVYPVGLKGPIKLKINPKNGIFVFINDKNCALIDYTDANPSNPCFAFGTWHHFAFTYKKGDVNVILDGTKLDQVQWQSEYVRRTNAGETDADVRADFKKKHPNRPFLDISTSGAVIIEPVLKPSASIDNFNIGYNNDVKFADIRIWNAALSAGTVSSYKDEYVPGNHPNIAKLQHNWKLNEVYESTEGLYSFPDRGILNVTAEIAADLVDFNANNYPTFLDEEALLRVPNSIAQAKSRNAGFSVDHANNQIIVTADKLEGQQKIRIFSTTGSMVYMAVETANAGTLTIAAPQSAGLYMVQVGEGNEAFVGKVAIK